MISIRRAGYPYHVALPELGPSEGMWYHTDTTDCIISYGLGLQKARVCWESDHESRELWVSKGIFEWNMELNFITSIMLLVDYACIMFNDTLGHRGLCIG